MVRKFIKERDKVTVEGITLPGILILQKVMRDGEQKLGDLAEELDLTSGAITALCDKLEKKGFALRRRLETDRRTVMLDITSEGRSMLIRNRDVGQNSISLLFGSFSQQELDAQKAAFTQITSNLEGYADNIMNLVKQNAEQPSSNKPAREVPTKSNFLSY
ncbi:MarR family transcriptional regulator [Paenibacillus cellulosilyticus]|nr:MarR family transcriptional regulator [Paenibacillus cellulosilyticus]QKS44630.1 MarR family transcriptional regulator [Paenibacillus cellulosilyticus]